MINRMFENKFFRQLEMFNDIKQCPLGFVDVGARGGVHPLVEPLASGCSIMCFEPDEAEAERLENQLKNSTEWANAFVLTKALSDHDGESVLHRFVVPTNDSLRDANVEMKERYNIPTLTKIGESTVPVTTMDASLKPAIERGFPGGNFIKLDTQGTEYDIFIGSDHTLKHDTVALFVEVCFFQIYENQKLFSDIELKLRDYGFSFYGFHSMHHRSCKQLDKRVHIGRERAIYADAVFFKDPLLSDSSAITLSCRNAQMLFCCAVLLGYYDFALELVRKDVVQERVETADKFIRDYAFHEPNSSIEAVKMLSETVVSRPEMANIAVGRFVDERRQWNDFDDVMKK